MLEVCSNRSPTGVRRQARDFRFLIDDFRFGRVAFLYPNPTRQRGTDQGNGEWNATLACPSLAGWDR
jgi:hypothetical protein